MVSPCLRFFSQSDLWQLRGDVAGVPPLLLPPPRERYVKGVGRGFWLGRCEERNVEEAKESDDG